MIKSITLCAVAAVSLSMAACSTSSSPTDLPPGQYNNVTRSTDSNGTTTVNRNTTTVGEDAYGNKTAVVQKKKSTDPRGLFNKSTSESTTVIDER